MGSDTGTIVKRSTSRVHRRLAAGVLLVGSAFALLLLMGSAASASTAPSGLLDSIVGPPPPGPGPATGTTDQATGLIDDPLGTVGGILEDPTGTVDGIVDDTLGTVDDLVQDPTGTVSGIVNGTVPSVVDDTLGGVDRLVDETLPGIAQDPIGSVLGTLPPGTLPGSTPGTDPGTTPGTGPTSNPGTTTGQPGSPVAGSEAGAAPGSTGSPAGTGLGRTGAGNARPESTRARDQLATATAPATNGASRGGNGLLHGLLDSASWALQDLSGAPWSLGLLPTVAAAMVMAAWAMRRRQPGVTLPAGSFLHDARPG
jgi:hypothetical protein